MEQVGSTVFLFAYVRLVTGHQAYGNEADFEVSPLYFHVW